MNLTPHDIVTNPRIALITFSNVCPSLWWIDVPNQKTIPVIISTVKIAKPVIIWPYSCTDIIMVVMDAGPAKIGLPIIAAIAGAELSFIDESSTNDLPKTILIPSNIKIIPPAILKSSIVVLNNVNNVCPKSNTTNETTPATNTEITAILCCSCLVFVFVLLTKTDNDASGSNMTVNKIIN